MFGTDDYSPFESEPTSPSSAIDPSITRTRSPSNNQSKTIKLSISRANRPYVDLVSRIAKAVDYEAGLYQFDKNSQPASQSNSPATKDETKDDPLKSGLHETNNQSIDQTNNQPKPQPNSESPTRSGPLSSIKQSKLLQRRGNRLNNQTINPELSHSVEQPSDLAHSPSSQLSMRAPLVVQALSVRQVDDVQRAITEAR